MLWLIFILIFCGQLYRKAKALSRGSTEATTLGLIIKILFVCACGGIWQFLLQSLLSTPSQYPPPPSLLVAFSVGATLAAIFAVTASILGWLVGKFSKPPVLK